MVNMDNWINVLNYFNDTGKERLRKALESGDMVIICVDRIGHIRTEMVEAEYACWLREVYGDKLKVNDRTAWGTVYYLDEQRGGKNEER